MKVAFRWTSSKYQVMSSNRYIIISVTTLFFSLFYAHHKILITHAHYKVRHTITLPGVDYPQGNQKKQNIVLKLNQKTNVISIVHFKWNQMLNWSTNTSYLVLTQQLYFGSTNHFISSFQQLQNLGKLPHTT